MRQTIFGGYDITERELENGWYELSTMASSMGEYYREHMRINHTPDVVDYKNFIQYVEGNK